MHAPAQSSRLAWFGVALVAACAALTVARFGTYPVATDHAVHMAGATPSAAAQGTRPATRAKPISCEPLPNVPGKSITTVRVHFPPDGFSPRHRHAGSVSVYVLSGTVRSQLNDGPVGTYKAGQTFFEPPGSIHTFAENASKTEPAEVLATFVADDCAQLTTYLD
jgi:quercetin dioxygenase-like cupin family protein